MQSRDINVKELQSVIFTGAFQATGAEVEDLKRQLQELRQKRSYYAALGRLAPATGFLVFIGFLSIYLLKWWQSPIPLAIGGFYLIIAVVFPLFTYAGALDTEIEAIESEIALRLTGAEATEQRAERLFRSHGIDLRRYYQQTLRHSAVVFVAGMVCIALGFGIIAYTFFSLRDVQNFDEKVLTAILGLISGILTNFVAVIYLRMFAETVSALTRFHQKLVTTNHLHFSNFLLAKISDEAKKDDNYAKLAILVASEHMSERKDG
jgi:hypothetical protein